MNLFSEKQYKLQHIAGILNILNIGNDLKEIKKHILKIKAHTKEG